MRLLTKISGSFCSLLAVLAVLSVSPVARAATTPEAPTYCSAAASGNSPTTAAVTLSWVDNSTNETQWSVYRSIGTGSYTLLSTYSSSSTATTGTVVSVSWPSAAFDTVYHFYIVAKNGSTPSAASNVATVGTYNLNGPINLTVTALDPFNVMMRWEENSVTEDGFAIERKTGTGAWEYLGTVGRDVLSLNASLLSPSGTFSFRARAVKTGAPTTPGSGTVGVNVSIYSNIVSVTAASYTLTVTKISGKPVVNLSWPNLPSEDGYQILFKAAGDASYSILAEVAKDILTYQATSPYIWPSTTYTFAVRPFKGTSAAGSMGISSEPSVTTDAYTLTATKVAGQPVVNLSWPDLPAESGYQILIKETGDASYSILGETAANVTTYQVKSPYIWPTKSYSLVVQPFSGTSANIISETSVANVTIDAYALTVTAVPGQATVNLAWLDLTNESGYQIVYKAEGDTSYAVLGEVAANVTTYQTTTAAFEPAKTYFYVVKPFSGTSANAICESSAASVTTDAFTRYWDGTGSDWNTVGNWSIAAGAAIPNPPAVPGTADIATFSISTVNATQTVALNASQTVAGLAFLGTNTAATTLLGGGTNQTLTLGGWGITVNSSTGAVTIGSLADGQKVGILLAGRQTWTNQSESMLTLYNGVNNSAHLLTVAGVGDTTLEGAVTGAGGLTKVGTGSLILSGTNTYNGTTTLSDGILYAGIAENLGISGPFGQPTTAAGSLIFNGGTLQYSASNAYDYSGRFAVTTNSPYSIDTNGRDVTFASALTANGTNNLIKSGAGTLTLSGANTFTGTTIVNGGTLTISGATGSDSMSINSLVINGGDLNVGGSNNLSLSSGVLLIASSNRIVGGTLTFTPEAMVTVDAGVTATIASKIIATSSDVDYTSFSKTGGGNLILSSPGNTMAPGRIVFNGGGTVTISGHTTNQGQTGLMTSKFLVGNYSANNIVNIPGRLLTNTVRIGESTFGGNSLNITGIGSDGSPTLDGSGSNLSWVVGGNSSNNSLTLFTGATMRTDRGNGTTTFKIGESVGGTGNSVTISGAGARWHSTTLINVGYAGSNNCLTISDGGYAWLQRLYVGGDTNTVASSNNAVLITDPRSEFTTDNTSNSWFQIGLAAGANNNSFTVANGGLARILGQSSSRVFDIGGYAGANNNYVKVTGAGSLIVVAVPVPLTLGGLDTGTPGDTTASGNHLDVFDGATLNSTTLELMGVNSSFNLGDGTGMSIATVGRSASYTPGVILRNEDSRLNFNSGKLIAGVDGAMVSGLGQIVLNGPAIVSTPFAGSTISNTLSGTGTFTKEGTGTLALLAPNNSTGATLVNSGILTLDYSTVADSKLNDSSALILGGGTLNLSSGTHVEIIDFTTLAAGRSGVTVSNGTPVLRMNAISQGVGIVNFGAANIASTNNANDGSGILGAWATIGGSDWATRSATLEGSGNSFITAYTGYTNINARGPSTIADGPSTNVRLNGDGTSGNINLGATTTTINTLLQSNANFPATVALSSGNVLATNGIMIGSGKQTLTIGVAAGNGSLRSATAGTHLVLNNLGVPSQAQVETATVVALGGATANGTCNVVITSAAISGSPVTVAVALTTTTETAQDLVAAAIRAALAANPAIAAKFNIGGTADAIVATRLANTYGFYDADDATLNIAIPSGLGLTAAPTSTNTLAGVTGVLTINAPIVANGSSGLATAGSVLLNGVNTFTGPTGVGGILALGGAGQLGDGNYAGAISISLGGVFTMGSSANQTLGGVISGGGSFIQAGTGTTLLVGANTYTGVTTINAGTLTSGSASAFGAATAASLVFGSGSTGKVQLNGNNLTVIGLNTNATVGSPILESGSATPGVDTLTLDTWRTASGELNSSSFGGILRDGSVRQLALIKNGPATLTLTGANSYSGGTTITGGTLTLGNQHGLGNGPLTLANGTVFQQSGFEGDTVAGGLPNALVLTGDQITFNIPSTQKDIWLNQAVSGTGTMRLVSDADGRTLTLSGAKTFSGGIIQSGIGTSPSVAIDNVASLGSGMFRAQINSASTTLGVLRSLANLSGGTGVTNAFDIAAGARLVVDTPDSNHLQLSGAITGGGSLAKTGTANLILSGANTYTGITRIEGGTLIVTHAAGLSATTGVTLAGGTGLNYAANTDAQLVINGPLDLTGFSGITLGGSIGTSPTSASIVATGVTTVAPGSAVGVNVFVMPGVTPVSGIYTLISGAGASTLNGATYTLGTVYNASNFTVGAPTATSNTLSVAMTAVTQLATAYYKGNYQGGINALPPAPGVWAASDGSTASNWTRDAAGTLATSLVPGAATNVIFSASGAINLNAMSLGNNMAINSLTVNGSTAPAETNPLTLSASGGYTLTLGSTSNPGITVMAGAGAVTFDPSIKLGVAQSWSNNSVNLLSLGGSVDNGGHLLTVTGTGDTSLGGSISGSGGLTKSGTSTLTLSGVNTYCGVTTVKAGTLKIEGNGSIANSTSIIIGDTGAIGAVMDVSSMASGFKVGSGQTLGGNGTIIGATTIEGIHTPGNIVGIQSFTDSLTYASTARIQWQLTDNVTTGRGSNFNGVDVTGGTFAIANGAIIDLSFGASVDFLSNFWNTDQSWLVVDLGSGLTDDGGSSVFTLGTLSGGSGIPTGTFGVTRTNIPGNNDILLNWIAPADGAYNLWIDTYTTLPDADRDPGDDPDADGLTNLEEFNHGTNPTLADTDGDGMGDLQEILAGRDPLKIETTVTLGSLALVYDGSAKAATATTGVEGLTVTYRYNGSSTLPVNAGSYEVVGTIDDPVYTGSATGTLVIAKASATATLDNLAQTYNGSPRLATATTTPASLGVTFTYAGESTAPVNAGSYAVVATINDTNYTGSATGTLVISKASATVTLGGLTQTYNGSPRLATATTTPASLGVTFTYAGESTAPTNAGSYAVVATIDDVNHEGTVSGTLVVNKAETAVTLGGLAQIYDGNPKVVSASTASGGLIIHLTYSGSPDAPIHAGNYPVVATIDDPNHYGSSSATLVVAKATATVTLDGLTGTYDGTPKHVSVSTLPDGLVTHLTYDSLVDAPTNAGNHAVVATIDDENYQGTATGTLVIAKAAAIVTLGDLAHTYDGTAKSASATTTPEKLTVNLTYDGSATVPVNAGTYAVVATIDDLNYAGTVSGSLAISKAAATVTLADLAATYDGSAKAASATTLPTMLGVTFKYNGSATVPKNAGTYAVVATIDDANYAGSASGNLVIGKAAAAITLGGLAQTYDGSAKHASATTSPGGLTVSLTYEGSATGPTVVGAYTVVGTVEDDNYAGTASGCLVIAKASATVTLGELATTYDGTAKSAKATTLPIGLTVNLTYDNSPAKPTAAGSYAVVGTVADANYEGTATGTLVIGKAAATVMLGGLAATYDGSAKHASVTTTPEGLTVSLTYDGLAGEPTNAGNYAVVATVNDTNYAGTASGTLVIGKGTATVTLGDLAQTYDGSAKHAYATTTPEGLTVSLTYDGLAAEPTNAGNYAVVATVNDSNYAGTASGILVIARATATVTLGALAQTYDGTVKPVSVTTSPVGLPVTLTYNGSATTPVNAGTYAVVATVNEPNYTVGSASDNLVIDKAAAVVTLDNMTATYDGGPKPVSVTTAPTGLAFSITYAGQSQAPTNAGTYAVEVTVNDANYAKTSTGSLVIAKADQTMTFPPIANQTADQTAVALQATAGSGLTPVFSVISGAATVAGQTLTLTGPGLVVVQAAQPGNANWNPAPPVQHTFHVFSGAFAQDFIWAKGFGGSNSDTAYGIATDSSGNAMVAVDFTGTVAFGTFSLTASGSSSDLALLKVAADGTMLSATRFGGTNADYAKAVAVDTTDNVILAGEFLTSTLIGGTTLTSAGSKDISLTKVNSAGTLQWSKRFGGSAFDSVYGLATDADGNILLTGDFSNSITFGTTTLTSSGGRDGFVAKLDPSGTPLWAMKIGGTGNDTAYTVTVSPSGQILVGGSFSGAANFGEFSRTSAGGTDGFAMMVSSAGVVQWATRFGGSSNDSAKAAAVDVTGGVCVTGSFAGTDASFGTGILASEGADDVFVARLNAADGSFLNVTPCGGAGGDAGLGLAADRFGSLYLSGSYSGTAYFGGDALIASQGTDAFVAKLSLDGNFQWVMEGSGAFNDSATSIAVNHAGHVLVAGLFAQAGRIGSHDISGGGLGDLFVAKINGPTPSFITTPGPVIVDAGDPFSIAAQVTGPNPVACQWYKNGLPLNGMTSSTLQVADSTVGDQGVYHVVASNFYGSAQMPPVTVTVRVPDRTLTLDAPAASEENRTLQVPLYLDSAGDVTGLTVVLPYDRELLNNASFVLGSYLEKKNSSVVVDAVAGTIRLVGSAYPTTIPAGRQLVGTFSFTTRSVPENAVAAFALTLSSISDLYGTPLGGYTKLIGDSTPVARRDIPGDANNNGRLDVSDAAELIRLYANPAQIRTWDNFLNDLNGDSILTEGDATRVLRVVARLDDPPSFPASSLILPMSAPLPTGTGEDPTSPVKTKKVPARSPRGAEPIPMDSEVPSAARLVLTRFTGADANKVLAQVYLDDVPAGQAGLSFRVDYPASILRITGAASLTIPSGGLPTGTSPQWNVTPGNNYASQTGSVSFAVAWGSSWTFTNGQAVASIVFELQAANLGQVHFPLMLTEVEAGPYNADGPSSPLAVTGGVVTFSRTYADWALATLGNANADPNADSDGDGFSNDLELAASTNPGDSQSRLQTTAAGLTPTGYTLRWFAAYGVNYRVRWSGDLKTWSDLTTSYTGTGAETEVTDPAPPVGGRFYRVEVIAP